NHSCVPNTMRSFVGDMLICRATRDVQEGEELFQQYVPVKTLVDVRNKEFEEGWGFEGRCVVGESGIERSLTMGDRQRTDRLARGVLC
ncbi:SET domain-containing protein-lysine N-methyltransferase, partial [Escherichia coli]|nr:SET domain-containing protein-lysine N-methyltransferase [Escherichia coli]